MDKNVIIILSDQLRRSALCCYGDKNVSTPNIDCLAEKGVRFANSCSTYPICVPFRFSLMTGEYAHTRLIPGIEWAMSPGERTLADEFNEAGYETAYVGKWHLAGGHGRMGGGAAGCGLTPVKKIHRGRWQRWFGFELRNNPFDSYYFKDDDPVPRKIAKYQTDGLFDIGMEYLEKERDKDKNFCLCLSVEPPHPPFIAPEELQKSWQNRDIILPPNFSFASKEEEEGFLMDRKCYYSMVENLDTNVGCLLNFLAENELAENTVILFFSDHGELNGSHGLRSKQFPYEESVGIPLIVYDPEAKETVGNVFSDPTNTEDLFPTILGLAGLQSKNNLPGLDLSPLIRGEITEMERKGVLLEFVAELRSGFSFYESVWRGIRTVKYKYTVKGDGFGSVPWQLFDLEKDPYEMNNLLNNDKCRQEAACCHQLLRSLLVETDDHFILSAAFGCESYNDWTVYEDARAKVYETCLTGMSVPRPIAIK